MIIPEIRRAFAFALGTIIDANIACGEA